VTKRQKKNIAKQETLEVKLVRKKDKRTIGKIHSGTGHNRSEWTKTKEM